jgi:selenocysteine-specific elongation factor
LAQEKAILHRQGQVALPDHRVRFQGKDAERLEAIEAALKETPFQPPGPAKLAERLRTAESEIHRLLKILIENDRVVRVEGKLFFHAEAVEEARDKLVDYLKREGELESVKFKYLLDTSRKFAIPLLDHFDRIGVTRRQGYTRLLRRP